MLRLSQQQRKTPFFYRAVYMLRKMLDSAFKQWEQQESQTPQLLRFALPIVSPQAELQLRSVK